MKILHILPANPYGGMQRLVIWLVAEQKRMGQDVSVLSFTLNPILSQELQERSIRTIEIAVSNPIVRFIQLIIALRKEKPTIVHLHVGLLVISIAGIFASRSVWIGHYHTYPSNKNIKLRLLNFINRNLCRCFIGVSESVSRTVIDGLRVPANNVYTVLNGLEINIDAYQTRVWRNNRNPIYGMATRLVEGKGIFDYVHLASLILEAQPQAKFLLAGTGPLEQELQNLIGEKGLSSNFYLLGQVMEMNKFWQSMDVAIFLSSSETFGLTILEAMKAGTPLVARLNGTGSDEIVKKHLPNFCAQPDDLVGMAEMCVHLATKKDLWLQVSRANYDVIHNYYSIQRMTINVNEVYYQALDPFPRNHVPYTP